MNDSLDSHFIDVTLDRHHATCGELVTGTFSWNTDKTARAAHVVLRYETDGRGDTDKSDVTVATFSPTPSGQHRFQLRVPVNGPASYVGDLITIRWEVRGYLDVARQRDPKSSAPVTIGPRQLL